MATYYDYVLAFIPLSMIGMTGLLVILGLSITQAIPLSAIIAVGLIGHAMFVRGPTSDYATKPPEPETSVETTPQQKPEKAQISD